MADWLCVCVCVCVCCRDAVGQDWNLSSAVVAWSAAHSNRPFRGVGWYFSPCVAWNASSIGTHTEQRLVASPSVGGDVSAWIGGRTLQPAPLNATQPTTPTSAAAAAFVLASVTHCGKGDLLALRVDGRGGEPRDTSSSRSVDFGMRDGGATGLTDLWWYASKMTHA